MAAPLQLVVFAVGGEEYGLPIERVREVAVYSRPRGLGEAEPWRLGVVLLRGELLPLLDLGVRLGRRAAAADGAQLVVVGDGAEVVGLVVDRVTGVRTFAAGSVAPVPVAADPALSGIASDGELLIAVLDADRLLGRPSGPDLATLSKRELQRRAAAAGIAGRSTMSKDELAAVLTAAAAP